MFVGSELEWPLQAIAVWQPLSAAVGLLSYLVTILAIRDTDKSEAVRTEHFRSKQTIVKVRLN